MSTISEVSASLETFSFLGAALTVAAMQLLVLILRKRFSPSSPASYRVTLLGPPGSGKTSAAIAVLDYMINSDVSGYLRLRGEATIEGVQQGVRQLGEGTFPPRTLETSTNIYRLDYFPPQSASARILSLVLPVPATYRVEIADFAGELTDDFAERRGALSKNAYQVSFGDDAPSNFLKWVAESDRCLLFVDMEKYLGQGKIYAERLTDDYIAFWQRYLDLHSAKLEPKAGTPVVLIYSKSDVLDSNYTSSIPDGDYGAPITPEQEERDKDFDRLRRYLKANSRDVKIVSLSVIMRAGGRLRLGIDQLAKSVLPEVRGLKRRKL